LIITSLSRYSYLQLLNLSLINSSSILPTESRQRLALSCLIEFLNVSAKLLIVSNVKRSVDSVRSITTGISSALCKPNSLSVQSITTGIGSQPCKPNPDTYANAEQDYLLGINTTKRRQGFGFEYFGRLFPGDGVSKGLKKQSRLRTIIRQNAEKGGKANV
jgi:hypothetical protein